jgi:hypothetical protein
MTGFAAIWATRSRMVGLPVTPGDAPLGYHNPRYRAWRIDLALECFLQLRQEGGCPFAALSGLEGDTVNAGGRCILRPDRMTGGHALLGLRQMPVP